MLGGLWGCVAYASAMFVAGDNDSFPEFLALTLVFATLPLAAQTQHLSFDFWLLR